MKWSYTTGGGVYSSPAIGSDGTIYVGSYDGKLYALTSSSTGGLASSPWPMFHHDNQHTGRSSGTINTPPILTNPGNKTINENQQLQFALSATDSAGDQLTYSFTGNPSGSNLSGNVFTWTPDDNQAGTYNVTFTVSDGKGGTDSKSITITVNNVNRSPTITSTAISTGTVGVAYSYDVNASDPDGDNLTYSLVTAPSGMSIDAVSGVISWTPSAAGNIDVSVQVSDGQGGTNTQSFTIVVSVPQGTEGTLKWGYATGSNVVSSPAIASDGTIYIGSYSNHKLYALTPNGDLKWSYTTGSYVNSSPAIASDGTIYIGSEDSKLYALTPTGDLKWSYTTGGYVASSPAIGSDGTIYVGSDDRKLYALSPAGALKWSYTTASNIYFSSPAIGSDGTIYVGSYDGKLYAVNPSGTLKWSYSTGGLIYSSPAIGSDGMIYVGSQDGKLYTLNPNGTFKWSLTTGGFVRSSPAIGSDGTIYVGSYDGHLYALTPTGTVKWSLTIGNNVNSSPAIGSDGTIYVGSDDYKLYAIIPVGIVKWSYRTGNSVSSSPAIGSDGTIYVGSYDGNLYAITSSSTGGLASSPWPMFHHDIQHTGNTGTVNTTPSIPILLFPTNGGTGISTSPTLVWNKADGATSYTLQVSQNSSFSSFVFNQALTDTSKQISGLTNGVTYYWRVNALNSDTSSEWSSTWSFTTINLLPAPLPPVQSSPTSGSIGISTSPTLKWNKVTGATSYTLQVSQNSSFSSFVFNQTLIDTSKQISGLANGAKYYWRVNALNPDRSSGWSYTWSFTTINLLPAPLPPVLSFPTNGGSGISTSPTLKWNKSIEATSYTLQVSQNSNFSNYIFNQTVTDTSKQISGLSEGLTYYWRVNALNPDRSSGWSYTWSFKTILSAPLQPVLSSPINGAAGVSESPVLRWNKVGGATSYTIQLSLNSNFSNFVLNKVVTDTNMQVSGLTNGVTYYWRVNAINPDRSSGWSLTWNFKTISSALLPPVLLSPDNGAQAVSASPLLKWKKVNGATSYTLQISQANNFSSFIINQVLTDTSKQISGLSIGITYYWRVNAFNTDRSSGWSYTWNFATKDGTPPAISDLTAGNAVMGQEKIITCNVTDNVLVKSVKLYYRQGGSAGDSSSFSPVIMAKQTGSTYSGTIPVSAITAKGIEFYIEATDNADNRKTAPEINPVRFPSALQVTIGSSGITRSGTGLPDIPSGTTNNDFRMISFPLVLNDKNPLSVLGIALGSAAYDKTKWRLLQYSGNALSEYPTVPAILPGYAYWLIVKTANPAIKVTDGLSVPTDVNFTVTIPAGWSQIGNPFNFNVSWNSIKDSTGASNLEPRIWKWTGTSYSTTINALVPWEGYFIYNATTGNVTLKIPPEEYTGTPKEGDFLKSINPDGWTIQIGAQAGNIEDIDNFAGVSTNASKEHDLLDFSEPPPIGDFVSLYFPHNDWKENARNYAGDFQPLENEGVTWDFVVESSLKEKVDLQFENLNSVPEDMKINLIDMKLITIIDLRTEDKYSFQPFIGGKKSDTTTSQFKLVIGNDSYIKQVMKDLPKLPEEYLLEQNFPNPFNPVTTIRFALPKEGRVSITIYNILGQEVKTVISEQLPAGIHEVIWDGTNNFGQPVASGMYLYCMRAGEKYVQTRKLVLLR